MNQGSESGEWEPVVSETLATEHYSMQVDTKGVHQTQTTDYLPMVGAALDSHELGLRVERPFLQSCVTPTAVMK